MILQREVIVTETDQRRLEEMVRSLRRAGEPYQRYIRQLEEVLLRARVAPPEQVDADVVTMNSYVRVRDEQSGQAELFTLVYHAQADPLKGKLSVLTPLGAAMLGARVGDVVQWRFHRGVRRLRIERIMYQPEAAGDWDV